MLLSWLAVIAQLEGARAPLCDQVQSESWEVLLKEPIREAVTAALAPEQQKYKALQLLGGVRFQEIVRNTQTGCTGSERVFRAFTH